MNKLLLTGSLLASTALFLCSAAQAQQNSLAELKRAGVKL